MLVTGGTLSRGLGNRMCEDASQLLPCLDIEVYKRYLDAIKSEDLSKIQIELMALADGGYDLVGSRGYVYSSKRLASLLESLTFGSGKATHANLDKVCAFPRTLGLRKAIINALNK